MLFPRTQRRLQARADARLTGRINRANDRARRDEDRARRIAQDYFDAGRRQGRPVLWVHCLDEGRRTVRRQRTGERVILWALFGVMVALGLL